VVGKGDGDKAVRDVGLAVQLARLGRVDQLDFGVVGIRVAPASG
jgi:hypothetical protein